MAEQTFTQKTIEKLLEVVEVEFKIPLGIAEIKFPATEVAKRWWENEKSRLEVEKAIRRAEEKFIAAHPENRLAQILHDFPLYADEEYRNVILGLLQHLDEEKITWLAEIKIDNEWNKQISRDHIRNALELYVPFLRHELNGIPEFREIITVRMLERIDERTERIERTTLETVEGVRQIETKLNRVLSLPETKQEPDYWYIPHPYPMPPNFTGRKAELKALDDWLVDDKDRLFILKALGGFGKSSLAWRWITTHVDPARWKKLIWWSFYEGDASFENFIQSTLDYLKLEIPQGQRPQVDTLLRTMQEQKILLILDGFERALRAYSSINAVYQGDEEPKDEDNQLDCVNINAGIFLKSICSLPNIKGKVLMTTRLAPRAVKTHGEFISGCHEVELLSMQPVDAVELFRKQGIKGTHTEIEAVCAIYGYHPLSLRLLIGRISKDFQAPNDIVVAQKLQIDGDLIQRKHHILKVSLDHLPPHKQKLLSTIACFHSQVDYHLILEAVGAQNITLENDLHDLVERGLLNFDGKNRKFDLHPIVRHHIYQRISPQERTEIHLGLSYCFAIHQLLPKFGLRPKVESIADIAPLIELYYHTAKAGKLDEAARLYYEHLKTTIYFQLGAYDVAIDLLKILFLDGEEKLPRLNDADLQIWCLNDLANSYAMNGQPTQAISLYLRHNNLAEAFGDGEDLAIGLGAIATMGYRPIGKLRLAETSFFRSIAILNGRQNWIQQAVSLQEFGRSLSYCGLWEDAERKFVASLMYAGSISYQLQSVTYAYRSLCAIQMCRVASNSLDESVLTAYACAQRAIELSNEWQNVVGRQNARDYIIDHWLLGTACFLKGDYGDAEKHLSNSITQTRAINNIEHEADILLSLARLCNYKNNFEDAKSLAEEALTITERCGYVLQGADVNLFLAQFALEQKKDKAKAKEYAETALKLAYCDGPPYYYKVAYQEAEKILEKLK